MEGSATSVSWVACTWMHTCGDLEHRAPTCTRLTPHTQAPEGLRGIRSSLRPHKAGRQAKKGYECHPIETRSAKCSGGWQRGQGRHHSSSKQYNCQALCASTWASSKATWIDDDAPQQTILPDPSPFHYQGLHSRFRNGISNHLCEGSLALGHPDSCAALNPLHNGH